MALRFASDCSAAGERELSALFTGLDLVLLPDFVTPFALPLPAKFSGGTNLRGILTGRGARLCGRFESSDMASLFGVARALWLTDARRMADDLPDSVGLSELSPPVARACFDASYSFSSSLSGISIGPSRELPRVAFRGAHGIGLPAPRSI